MNGLRTGFSTASQRLIAVQTRDEEEALLGRLFNTMMVISLGVFQRLDGVTEFEGTGIGTVYHLPNQLRMG